MSWTCSSCLQCTHEYTDNCHWTTFKKTSQASSAVIRSVFMAFKLMYGNLFCKLSLPFKWNSTELNWINYVMVSLSLPYSSIDSRKNCEVYCPERRSSKHQSLFSYFTQGNVFLQRGTYSSSVWKHARFKIITSNGKPSVTSLSYNVSQTLTRWRQRRLRGFRWGAGIRPTCWHEKEETLHS